MSITSSLYTGVSGLLTHGAALSVVGNNITNVNTVGYKASRADFADLLSSLEGEVRIGRGVRMVGVTRLFVQGALQTTQNATDLAIQGAGFFVVKDPGGASLYTRAGQFLVDADGALVNPEGFTLQGFPVDTAGQVTGALDDIVLGDGTTLAPKATTGISLTVNLDASAVTPAADWPGGGGTDAPAGEWIAASNFSTTLVTVYDSLGQSYPLSFMFRKTDANTWEYRVLTPISNVQADPADPDNLIAVGEGTLAFNSDGTLDIDGSTINDITISGLVNGADDITIAADQLDFGGTTQFAQGSAVSISQQDGYSSGALSGITIDARGLLTGQFTNGGLVPLYQIALANFPSPAGLAGVGNNLFAQSFESGNALTGAPGTGGFGTLLSSGLELSTVDISQEFVNLISAQRGFQVSSRIVTVADQMYDEAANLKR